MKKTNVSALGALVILTGLLSGCASEEAATPVAPTATVTATTEAAETVFADYILLGEAPEDGAPRALWAGRLDSLAYYVRPSEEFKATFSGDDMFAVNQLAGQYFIEQIVDSEVLDVKDVDAIREHAAGLGDLLTTELAEELAAAEPRWDDVLFPTNLGQNGMTADPARETEAGTRYSAVDITLTALDVSEDGERAVLVYQADTVRPVLGGSGESLDEHRSIVGTFEVVDVDTQWRISDVATEMTTLTTAPGEQLG